jgi:hypothetical protein
MAPPRYAHPEQSTGGSSEIQMSFFFKQPARNRILVNETLENANELLIGCSGNRPRCRPPLVLMEDPIHLPRLAESIAFNCLVPRPRRWLVSS